MCFTARYDTTRIQTTGEGFGKIHPPRNDIDRLVLPLDLSPLEDDHRHVYVITTVPLCLIVEFVRESDC